MRKCLIKLTIKPRATRCSTFHSEYLPHYIQRLLLSIPRDAAEGVIQIPGNSNIEFLRESRDTVNLSHSIRNRHVMAMNTLAHRAGG